MAYTRDWDTEVLGTPPGSRDADEIDDSIREFKVDIDERLTDIVFDPSADPLVLKTPGVAIDGTQNVVIGATLAALLSTNLKYEIADLTVHPTAVSVGGSAAVNLSAFAPRGSTIKAFSVRCVCLIGATVSITLRKISDLGVNTNVVIVSATPGAGIQLVDSGAALTEVISSTADYYLEINIIANGSSATSAVLYRVGVTYKLAGTP